MNELKGFRGLLTIAMTWLVMLADTFATQLTGITPQALKAAFIASLPITIKLIWTDLRPRLK